MLVGNVTVDLVDRESAISLILDSLSASDPLAVASANLDHIHHFADDESWVCRPPAVSVNGPAQGLRWLTLLDGVPLVRTANARSGRHWPKLSGSDLIYPILEYAAVRDARVGFLGGTAEAHNRLRELVGESLPAVRIAGTWAPTRSQLTDPAASERLATEISDADVDILVVGLGKPLQEEWITRFGPATGARVLLAFGAVVDFLARRVRRAPEPVTQAGVEWAWRLLLEPRRLGRRYLVQGPPALLQLKRRARVVEAAMAASPQDEVERGRFVSAGAHADVAAVVVTYNSASDIPLLIDDLRVAARDRPIRLIVVDNQSSDDTVNVVRAHDDIMLVESGGNLGYGGGMNAGLRLVGHCDAVLMLNPDLRLAPDAITRLFEAINENQIGAVVPLMLDEDGATYSSLRREPALTRAIGDALFGSKMWRNRPAFLSELDYRPASYVVRHDVDWATGAALLVPAAVAREVGEWWDEFPIYSEETDYFRRIRESGRRIRFEPSAVVKHRGGGSGTSPGLAALMAVNRVRYTERHHGRAYSALFRAVAALAESLRSYDADHRRTLAVILNRRRWQELPQATKPIPAPHLSGPRQRGAVIVPAYNEAAVIKRTLGPLSRAAVDGFIELVVVCNGCTDDTADVARSIPGVRVVELEEGSKPAALNAGDKAATLWPRLYLDADIQISAAAVLAVLDRLGQGDVMVARPDSRYDSGGASALVRSYYRARRRIPQHKLAMWGAGAYGLSAKGHQRFGAFPTVTGDDLYVDTRFDAHEKAVVATDPSVVKTPADAKSLLAILRRGHRCGTELFDQGHGPAAPRNTSVDTAVAVVRAIRGPRSAVDAAVYLGMALAARWHFRNAHVWERDESSRSSEWT
jgi:exopolysaccharide biosynthesis WecB/TagA/CpsF family protein